MQPNETFYGPLKWGVVLVVLLCGLLLGGCDRRQQSKPSRVPEVATVTIQPQQAPADYRIAGSHLCVPCFGNSPPGEWNH